MTSTFLPITALILTNRHDEKLERAVESVKWCAEIVIIDNTTDSNWSALKKKFPHLKVKTHSEPISNFARLRNQSQRLASQAWVLWLDSDEELPSGCQKVFEEMIRQSEVAGWYFRRVDYFHNQALHWGETKNVWLLRFGQKSKLRWFGAVHEVAAVDGPTSKTKVAISHFAHPNIASFMTKITYYAQLEAAARVKHHKPWSIWQLIFYPLGKWFWNVVVQQGWRDGWRGISYATVMSLHSIAVRVFWWEYQHE